MTAKDNKWNEETLSENPAVELLEALGYQYLSLEVIEPLREGERSSILIKPLQEALFRLNPWLSKENCDRAIRTLTRINAVSLIEANEQAYDILTRGTTVWQDLSDGIPSHTVKFIDFNNPNNIYNIVLFILLAGLNFNRISVDSWLRNKSDRLPK